MGGQLDIMFLPLMAHGHMIPALEMAKLFTSRGLKTTIISTPSFSSPVINAQAAGLDIGLVSIYFPPHDSDLPDHITSLDQVLSDDALIPKFFKALSLIQHPVEDLLRQLNPNCLISDMFLPWTADSAAKFGIPRLVFHGTSYFSLCAAEELRRHKPFRGTDHFVLPNLPHRVEMATTEVADFDLNEDADGFSKWMREMREADGRSYGVVVNSFYELEPDYADHYRNALGRRAWNIGPLLLYNNSADGGGGERGKKPSIDVAACVAWLDSKKANSVVYVCFGSMAKFSSAQLKEIANGLDAAGHDFVWVVREGGDEEWVKGMRGLIIRGWAPQVVILDHPAVGGFVTHCGWNSTLEGVCSGVPMATWPLFAEQFYNEKLVTEVLRIGVSVGNKKWRRAGHQGVGGEAVAKAVRAVMEGESAAEMRRRAAEYREMARKAVGEGGSSYNDITDLIQQLTAYGL
ncbi:hypothetical protein SASPL_104550 [Salvia splendens]|uniref:Glycosyltransferase n=1 Tax=Salvia splendens TaxID=180675 RepID=A0A8X8YK46_SALSN|nr:scopoletin glucosyltransferase-like [Salvia splendens]KAG6432954.1 hypothetical protein SASPL_104550 [Salvia splendens]